jgi:ankyrin repeat protein
MLERSAGTTPHKYGWTPLHLASLNGQVELVSMLIERGAYVTAQNNGLTPLHLAADVRAQNDHVSMIPLPFHLASHEGHVEVIGMLIENGADVTAQNNDGSTPLHLALQEGRLEVAGMLVERRAAIISPHYGTLFCLGTFCRTLICVLRSLGSRTPGLISGWHVWPVRRGSF